MDQDLGSLEKRPGDRPQSAEEILHLLDAVTVSGQAPVPTFRVGRLSKRRLSGTIGAVVLVLLALVAWWRVHGTRAARDEIRSIAVLPFENTSGDTAFDYLEEGISDQVREALNAIPGLAV